MLRALWSSPRVSFQGRFDRVDDAGINPLPVQRPIPIWVGAFQPPAIRRAGRLADGLFLNPRLKPDGGAREAIGIFHDAARAEGRDPGELGLDVTLFTEGRGAGAIREECHAWRELGAIHVTVRTITAGHRDVGEHLAVLEAARTALD